jgi:hypothetical protein
MMNAAPPDIEEDRRLLTPRIGDFVAGFLKWTAQSFVAAGFIERIFAGGSIFGIIGGVLGALLLMGIGVVILYMTPERTDQ